MYSCVVCGTEYADYLGGSYFCSNTCRAVYEAWA